MTGTLECSPGLDVPETSTELAAIRKSWRRRWGQFSLLRHENSIRRPSWRVEMETKAWHDSRERVRQYAQARGWTHP